jgi:hypothetical protein
VYIKKAYIINMIFGGKLPEDDLKEIETCGVLVDYR